MVATANLARIEQVLGELGMTLTHPRLARLVAFNEATELVSTRCLASGEEHRLSGPAASAWVSLAQTAADAGVALELVSGFRSYAYQRDLIRKKREAGRTLEDILQSVAPPGFSEHHTGEAADIGSPGCEDLTASFAATDAFRWLAANAGRFGWTMSYPAGNSFGYVYEPWHWKWNPIKTTP
jgi:D-alanyl-D-alanine carboxypeptidase